MDKIQHLIMIYVSGGDSNYFTNSITKYTFTSSVFDLVIISVVKVIIIAVVLLPTIETYTYKQIDNYDMNLTYNKTLLQGFLIVLHLGLLGFTGAKSGLILNDILHEESYVVMHSTFNALVISSTVFSLLQFFMAISSTCMLRRLKKIRILHRLNEEGQEIDKDGKPITKTVDIRRLASLAIPVSQYSI